MKNWKKYLFTTCEECGCEDIEDPTEIQDFNKKSDDAPEKE